MSLFIQFRKVSWLNEEIGSEFFQVDGEKRNTFLSPCGASGFFLSGRTAIDFIIKDIKSTRAIRSIYFPSYCCQSMIQPFFDNGIRVFFYNVVFSNGCFSYDVDPLCNCDAFFVIQYFGFFSPSIEEKVSFFKKRGMLVIEDATHSWFSKKNHSPYSDYVFSSFRKWTGVPGGAVVIKCGEKFFMPLPEKTNIEYVTLRRKAFEFKKCYFFGEADKKNIFLELFSQAERNLEKDYKNYKIPGDVEKSILSLDVQKISRLRRENAAVLLGSIKKFSSLEIPSLRDGDVPLFVPIFIREQKRNLLKDFLIENKVYCPIHWPISEMHKTIDTSLYRRELSLVCDQRYSQIDMERFSVPAPSLWPGSA